MSNKNIMKKTNDLHAFLRKHGAVRKFKANVENLNLFLTFYSEIENGKTEPQAIRYSFVAESTPEGKDYWIDLSEKYEAQFKHTS